MKREKVRFWPWSAQLDESMATVFCGFMLGVCLGLLFLTAGK